VLTLALLAACHNRCALEPRTVCIELQFDEHKTPRSTGGAAANGGIYSRGVSAGTLYLFARYFTSTNSTSKTRVELAGIIGG